MENLNYFYGMEAEQFSFYRIPKALFTDARFRGISAEAKTLYGLLLDRMSLSVKNGWQDSDGKVFIVFPVEEISEALGCAHQKALKLLSELEQKCGLIERRRQGLGKPNLIYVKNFVEPQKSSFLKYENHTSGDMKISFQEVLKSASNKTDISNTDLSDTEIYPISPPANNFHTRREDTDRGDRKHYREIISENIAYDVLLHDYPNEQETISGMLELIVDTVCTKRKTLRIAGDDKSAETVKSVFLKLTDEHIRYCLDCLKETKTNVRNIRQYLLAMLYNAPLTISAYYSAQVQHDMAND